MCTVNKCGASTAFFQLQVRGSKCMSRGKIKQSRGRPKGQGPHGEATKPIRIPLSLMQDVKEVLKNKGFRIPMYASTVPAGPPLMLESFADDYIDLNHMIVKNKENTYLLKVKGDSMINAGIGEGDILVVDRSIEPRHKDIVIAVINNELTVKRLFRQNGDTMLMPENHNYEPILIKEGQHDFDIYGVVSYVIRKTA